MSTAEDASWWWSGGVQSSHHGGRGFMFRGGMADIQYSAAQLQEPDHQQGGSHYIEEQNQNVGLEMECSRPRLRWSKELHDKFVSAVNQLGGASNATPKTIRNIMRVEDLNLFQIKSHLQKYRLGKISRRLLTRDVVPVDENKSMDMESCHGSFDNNRDETSKYGNILNYMVEPYTEKLGDDGNPPLFPPIPASNKHDDLYYDFPEWSGLLDSSTGDYLNPLGHLSCTSTCDDSSLYITTFGNFFEDADRFLKIKNHDHLIDNGFVAMDASGRVY